MHFKRWMRLLLATLPGIALAFSFGPCAKADAIAGGVTFFGGANWSSTADPTLGAEWLAGSSDLASGISAVGSYGNVATTSLNSEAMMWYCGVGRSLCTFDSSGNALGTGPTRAFFSIAVGAPAPLFGSFSIIGDDFVELWVNGHFIFNAVLDQNQDTQLQPVPLQFTIDGNNLQFDSGVPLVLRSDLSNVLGYPFTDECGGVTTCSPSDNLDLFAIEAMDGALPLPDGSCAQGIPIAVTGGTFCEFDRGYEYVYATGTASWSVPEPSSASLLGGALICLWFVRRHTRLQLSRDV